MLPVDLMFPSSAIRVLEATSSKLVILDPPNYLLGGILVGAGVALAIWLLRGHSNARLLLIVLVPIFISGISALTSKTELEFSRDAGTLAIRSLRFGFYHGERLLPLASLRYATVEASRGARRLTLVMTSGSVLYPTGASAREGDYAAANAINDFIGTRAPR